MEEVSPAQGSGGHTRVAGRGKRGQGARASSQRLTAPTPPTSASPREYQHVRPNSLGGLRLIMQPGNAYVDKAKSPNSPHPPPGAALSVLCPPSSPGTSPRPGTRPRHLSAPHPALDLLGSTLHPCKPLPLSPVSPPHPWRRLGLCVSLG